MKQLDLFFAILLLVSCIANYSCNKKSDQPRANGKILPGVWERRGAVSANIDFDPNVFKPGNRFVWKFSDLLYQNSYKDSVYKSGSYAVAHTGTNPVTNETINRFIFDGTPAESFDLRNDTLYIFYGLDSSFEYYELYIKISDDSL